MVDVTASLVKELRERTGSGIMDCKIELLKAHGNIDLAIENMRKSGAIKAAKKLGNIAADGIINTKIEGNYGIILEVNCQTDFVAKDSSFQSFVSKVLNAAFIDKITNVDILKEHFKQENLELVSKIGENINIRRIASLEGEILESYIHGAHIGVLIAAKGANKSLIKQIAMHIAASKPECVNSEDLSTDLIKKEHQIQVEIAIQSGKPKNIAEKIVTGRMKKFANEISLTGQSFVIDPSKTVKQVLKEHHIEITDFIRFELGEGIEKIRN